VKPLAQSKSKRQKVFETEKQHSRSTDPHDAHEAFAREFEGYKTIFAKQKGLSMDYKTYIFR